MRANRGFTLIELLIVVAIISILASIAMVNYLEASVRAKTGRAKADIRSIVTALESYAVDHNAYPTYHYTDAGAPLLEFHIGGRVPGFGIPDPAWDGRNPLTTPVSYITTFPNDPFKGPFSRPAETRQYLYVNWDYAVQQVSEGTWHNTFLYAKYQYGSYRIHSRGPDGDGPDSGTPYDPTNGTTSDGDITYGPKSNFEHYIYFPR